MKILFQTRATLFSIQGGDTVQIIKTAEALRAKGCRVDISTELEPDLSGYDIVHLFHIIRPQEVYLQALNAKRKGRKVALSTIYVDYKDYEKNVRSGMAGRLSRVLRPSQVEYLKVLAGAVKNLEANKGTLLFFGKGYRSTQLKVVDMVDVLLPNSESEKKRVVRDFPSSGGKAFTVVPNAVDTELFNPEKVHVSEGLKKYEGCVLCVGRIEGRKCQLDIIRAMRGLPWPLVLIGKPAPSYMSYFRQIKKEAGPDVHIIGPVDHVLLPQFYKSAKVHALVSWMETTGLSSLEAGAMGCNLVITDKGDTRDYFGDRAFYCEPGSVESIRDCLVRAHEAPANPALSESILKNYNWEKAAEKTLEGYLLALNS